MVPHFCGEFSNIIGKGLGIDVYFERENIHSISNDGEVMLTILASYAQEESRSASENGKWRIRKRFEQGEVFQLQPVFGYLVLNKSYVIHPKQAEVVKLIFDLYAAKVQVKQICNELNSRGASSFWDTKWNRKLIRSIIRNSFYTGQVELQKYFVENHITKKLLPNNGELSRYIVHDHHPAIISKELYRKAQDVLKSRQPKSKSQKMFTPFSRIITCGHCGRHFMRRNCSGIKKWQCETYWEDGKQACPVAKIIPESVLIKLSCDVLKLAEFDPESLRNRIQQITVPQGNVLFFHLVDGTFVKRTWEDRSRRESWTPEMREKARQKALGNVRSVS